ncbi:ATP-binding domain-containing protein [Leptothrix sp. BB-4]
MARISPLLDQRRPTTAGEYTELAVLKQLRDGLDDRFHLFHGMNWVVTAAAADHHGELDIVVVNDAGDVAVLEVKAGALTLDGSTLHKTYRGESKDVIAQARRQFGSILGRLKSANLGVRLLHLLVLPDQRLGDLGTVAYPRERIADADDCVDLAGLLMIRLGSGLPDQDRKARVLAFFDNRLPQQPDVSQMAGTLRRQVSELSDGLATWVPRIQAPNGVIRVRATAGSGKTQLALRLLRDACVDRQRAAYVCFNRPLADLMRQHAPDPVDVATFHQLAWLAAGSTVGAQDRLAQEQALAAAIHATGPDLDLLVIDELQDFLPDWVTTLIQRVRASGRLVLLDDPAQCLYPDRDEIEVDGAVVVTCDDNHRSPRRIVETINLLDLADRPIRACGPLRGESPNILTYDSTVADRLADSLIRKTIDAVQDCLDCGHPLQDIVLLCWRGREHSRLAELDRLGDWPLARFTGRYDASGEPVWTAGDLRVETVRRFKGQSAPAVVLSEVDFDQIRALDRRMLFVALTRAQMKATLVMTSTAEQELMRQIP